MKQLKYVAILIDNGDFLIVKLKDKSDVRNFDRDKHHWYLRSNGRGFEYIKIHRYSQRMNCIFTSRRQALSILKRKYTCYKTKSVNMYMMMRAYKVKRKYTPFEWKVVQTILFIEKICSPFAKTDNTLSSKLGTPKGLGVLTLTLLCFTFYFISRTVALAIYL